ncbi:hypothetical protein SAMN05444394_3763 [Algoriphagus halophilus]|uniref:Uncharacterized protein n=1 Tax=Algoriphagus halophilus TaxID=226505 RepID=A0A1N6HDJ0_9BACT|nr:hypothetical protein SAMN05444394_3763 [Algoriphagus halophilus]
MDLHGTFGFVLICNLVSYGSASRGGVKTEI